MCRPILSKIFLIGLAGVCLLLSGCAFPFQRGPVFDNVDLGDFPIDRAELLAFSYHHYRPEGPASSVARSLIAAQNVMLRDPDNELANFFAARAALWLIEFGGDEIKREKLASQALGWTEKLIKMDPSRGVYHFLAGAHLGFKVRESLHPSLIRLRKVHEYFERAVQLEFHYDFGGPLRALGTLLVRSPSWPTGVGDLDEGIAQLERAATLFPFYPVNHLYLALAYIEDKRYADAEASLNKVLEQTKGNQFGIPGKHWREQAKRELKKVKKEEKP